MKATGYRFCAAKRNRAHEPPPETPYVRHLRGIVARAYDPRRGCLVRDVVDSEGVRQSAAEDQAKVEADRLEGNARRAAARAAGEGQ